MIYIALDCKIASNEAILKTINEVVMIAVDNEFRFIESQISKCSHKEAHETKFGFTFGKRRLIPLNEIKDRSIKEVTEKNFSGILSKAGYFINSLITKYGLTDDLCFITYQNVFEIEFLNMLIRGGWLNVNRLNVYDVSTLMRIFYPDIKNIYDCRNAIGEFIGDYKTPFADSYDCENILCVWKGIQQYVENLKLMKMM